MVLLLKLEDLLYRYLPTLQKDVAERPIKILLIFLGIALGSAFELETQLIIAKNLNFLSPDVFGHFEREIQHIQNMIIKLQSTL